MDKLSTTQANERDRLVKQLADLERKLETAFNDLNTAIHSAWEKVEAIALEYNQAISEVEKWRDNTATNINDYYYNRDEHDWQTTQEGQDYETWMDRWNDDEFEEIELDPPDEIEWPELDAAQRLKDLPDRP